MAGRFFAVALGAAAIVSGGEVTINVFGLFRPTTLIVRGAGRTLTVTEPISFDEQGDWTIEVPGRITRRFTGKLAILKRGDALEPAITMDLELAVAAAVAAEMPADAPAEALRAAAVLARSFYLASGRSRFCDTTHCQFLREATPAASVAAKATAGTVIAYRGQAFAALYSASCGGSTLRAGDVGLGAEPYPYFSVRCERCERDEKPWRKTVPILLAGDLLRERSEQARLKVGLSIPAESGAKRESLLSWSG